VTGSLHLPAETAAVAVIADRRGAEDDGVAPLAAALLASRGVLVFLVTGGKGEPADVLASVPSAPARVARHDTLPLPPGVPARTAADAAAWDALLADLGARARHVAR
jgi:hypothetical protein